MLKSINRKVHKGKTQSSQRINIMYLNFVLFTILTESYREHRDLAFFAVKIVAFDISWFMYSLLKDINICQNNLFHQLILT